VRAWRSNAPFAAGSPRFDRTLRCARDPCPADGLAPPGCARPRRQPLVRAAPGSIRLISCRTSRLSTPRARGPVLAAGARKHDGHARTSARTTRRSSAAVRPLPNRRHWRTRCLAPSPEGQWRRHAARPARRWGPVPGRHWNVANATSMPPAPQGDGASTRARVERRKRLPALQPDVASTQASVNRHLRIVQGAVRARTLS
jgi:hypothetical protein